MKMTRQLPIALALVVGASGVTACGRGGADEPSPVASAPPSAIRGDTPPAEPAAAEVDAGAELGAQSDPTARCPPPADPNTGLPTLPTDVPTVRIGLPRVKGPLDAKTIGKEVKCRIAAVMGCYEGSPAHKSQLGGEILVKLTIAQTGAVTASGGTGFDDRVALCVADVIRTIKFESSRGDSAVEYPLRFMPHRP
jgi:hypothetical protein